MSQEVGRYAIIGGTLWGNRGAEAMVTTAIGEMRERDPAAEFLLFSYLPAADRCLNRDAQVTVFDATPRTALLVHVPFALASWLLGALNFRIPDVALPRSVRLLRDSGALLDVSGISFHDGRLAVVAYNIVCLWPALLLRVPVVRLSQASGPFRHPLNRLPARWITKAATHTFARGSATAGYLSELGVPSNRWSVAADVAFAYRDSYSLTEENVARVQSVVTCIRDRRHAGRRTVGLVPSSLVFEKAGSDGEDYLETLLEIIRHETSRGFDIVVLPNATRARSEGLRNNDIGVIRLLRERLDAGVGLVDPSAVTLVDYDVNTQAIRRLLASCAVVITSRFHAMIAALALGVPTVALGWSHKYVEVLEMFGLEQDAVSFDEPIDRVLVRVDEVLAGENERRSAIARALPDVMASSRSQFDAVAGLVHR